MDIEIERETKYTWRFRLVRISLSIMVIVILCSMSVAIYDWYKEEARLSYVRLVYSYLPVLSSRAGSDLTDFEHDVASCQNAGRALIYTSTDTKAVIFPLSDIEMSLYGAEVERVANQAISEEPGFSTISLIFFNREPKDISRFIDRIKVTVRLPFNKLRCGLVSALQERTDAH